MLMSAIVAGAALCVVALIAGLGMPRSQVTRQIAAFGAAAVRDRREPAVVRRLIDPGARSKLVARFAEAGWYRMTVSRFYGIALVAIGVGAALAAGMTLALGLAGPLAVAVAALLVLAGALIPDALLTQAIAARKIAIQRALPDWLDVLSTQIEAGIALNAALATSLNAVRGPLAEELREVLADVRLGHSRADALSAMAARVRQIDVSTTVTAIVQNERLGGNIGGLLDELASEARHRRLMRAEECAARLPVKMVVPMALFMLPALLVMIFGPVISELMGTLK